MYMHYKNNRGALGTLRPKQIITTFGPGAIVDAVKDSVTVLDINYWKATGKKITDDGRLASLLHVGCFYTPKTSKTFDGGDIPVVSFPYMHVCSSGQCGRIFDIRDGFDLDKYISKGVRCPVCGNQAYPARFISVCEAGHMDDFPWHWWVHKGKECKPEDKDKKKKKEKGEKELRMYSTGSTSSLGDLWVECRLCGEKRNMSGATQQVNFTGLSCTGKHPFRPDNENEKCNKPLIPSQRGASNVYFSVTKSAISIPPYTNPLYQRIRESLSEINTLEEKDGAEGITWFYSKHFSEFPRDDFDEALHRIREKIEDFTTIKRMEYEGIIHHADPQYASVQENFKAEDEVIPPYLKKYFSKIVRITRLREVKALLGFTRVYAPDPDAEDQPNIVWLTKAKKHQKEWLPAVEIHGEGIFIEFNQDTLSQWVKSPQISTLSKRFALTYKKFCTSRGWQINIEKDARYVMMHTFSHLLIRQMAMSSGYSSAALRERIYFDEKMSAILLYTGSADTEGSLGGLVELGDIEHLNLLMKDAFQEALLCTNDPGCCTNEPDSFNANGAACHSCCMISETACENGNRMLDRSLIVPLDKKEDQAFFKDLVAELCHLEI